MEVSLDIQDDVALIKMDDGKKNAITLSAVDGLNEALDKSEADAKAIVLAGRPSSFCAGFDLKVMKSGNREDVIRLSNGGGRLALRFFSSPMPLVVACTGHGFTIGAIWLAACDTRIGELGDYKYGMTETALGMVLPAWAFEPLKARLNPAHYVAALAQSKLFDPESAVAAGFIDEVVPEGKSIEAALAAAGPLAKLPAKAYGGNKLAGREDAIERMATSLA